MSDLRWSSIRHNHVASPYVYLPGDPRRLRFRTFRLFSRRAGGGHDSNPGYFLVLEDPTLPTSRIGNLNHDAERTVRVATHEAALAAAAQMVEQGLVAFTPLASTGTDL